jgi:hypothetical protein
MFPDLAVRVGADLEERALNRGAAVAAAEEGMERALHAARVQTWKLTAEGWLERMPPGRLFTNDNLYVEIGNPSSEQNRNNVVGAWIAAKAREGRIEHTGRSVKSSRKSRHANRVGVWRKVR